MHEIRRIVVSVGQCIVPLLQTIVIGFVVVFSFALIGIESFSDKDPHSFGTVMRACVTLFQVIAFGWWPIESLPFFEDSDLGSEVEVGTLIYVASFVLVAVLGLGFSIFSVFLERFLKQSEKEIESQKIQEYNNLRDSMNPNPLDPLMEMISLHYETSQDLSLRITTLFETLDVGGLEGKGTLSFNELHKGLKYMGFSPKIHLTREDFERVVSDSIGSVKDELEPWEFEQMIRRELWKYTKRKTHEARSLTNGNAEMQALLTATKLMLTSFDGGVTSGVESQVPEEAVSGILDEIRYTVKATREEQQRTRAAVGEVATRVRRLEVLLCGHKTRSKNATPETGVHHEGIPSKDPEKRQQSQEPIATGTHNRRESVITADVGPMDSFTSTAQPQSALNASSSTQQVSPPQHRSPSMIHKSPLPNLGSPSLVTPGNDHPGHTFSAVLPVPESDYEPGLGTSNFLASAGGTSAQFVPNPGTGTVVMHGDHQSGTRRSNFLASAGSKWHDLYL